MFLDNLPEPDLTPYVRPSSRKLMPDSKYEYTLNMRLEERRIIQHVIDNPGIHRWKCILDVANMVEFTTRGNHREYCLEILDLTTRLVRDGVLKLYASLEQSRRLGNHGRTRYLKINDTRQ